MKHYIVTSPDTGKRVFVHARSPGHAKQLGWNTLVYLGKSSGETEANYIASAHVEINPNPPPETFNPTGDRQTDE